MSATLAVTSNMTLLTKYGNTISNSPQTSGTTAFCFFPYRKKPRPTELKSTPHINDEVSSVILLTV